MATRDLGQIRDKITGVKLEHGSTASGKTATYSLKTEMNPNGIGSFAVYNGADGAGQTAVSEAFTTHNAMRDFINEIGSKNVVAILSNPSTDEGQTELKSMTYGFGEDTENLGTVINVNLWFPDGTALSNWNNRYYYVVYFVAGEGTSTQTYIDVGHNYEDMSDALDALYLEADSDPSRFQDDIKLIAYLVNSDSPVTVIGYDGANHALIGYVSDWENNNAYFFKATKVSSTWNIVNICNQKTKLYKHHLYDGVAEVSLSIINTRSTQITESASSLLAIVAKSSIVPYADYFDSSVMCLKAANTTNIPCVFFDGSTGVFNSGNYYDTVNEVTEI